MLYQPLALCRRLMIAADESQAVSSEPAQTSTSLMIAHAMVSICAFMIAPPFLRVFLALASALWVDRLRSGIDRTSAQSTAKLVLDRIERPGSL